MNQYMGKVLKAWMMLFAMSLALAGTATLSSCSSDDDPYFTVSEDDDPRILNTDLADKKLDRKTNLKMEIKVTPVHYTTVTWLLDDTQIAEGTTIDQALPVGNHTLKIVATTTKGKRTSRTLNVVVIPAADDPTLGTNAIELWVAPGAETTIHKCSNLGTVTKVLVGGKEAAFEVLEEGTALKLTAPAGLENGDYDITLVDGSGVQFPSGTIKVTTEARPSMENTIWEGEFAVTWGTPFDALKDTFLSKVKAGTILRVYVDGKGQGTATTSWWNNLLTGKGDPERGDIMVNGPATWEFELTDLSIQLLTEQQGLFIVGDGYTVKKVTIE
ncbi:hypothetical protein [Segatella copri]|uniref:hypothetical protein n=1 Tax=Segatella copri TaxID=165179 RepID=UPI002939D08A|nr:hypothetical protein [Segatella copri]MDV3105907.1 hypothetical protein [Segatella copri]MDV3112769.1 hypothetical protein [Segatella copri]WOF88427.1 hypothetical protein RJT05_03560 [Segatella copri]WOF94585.1 hypothetical protein RJT10_03755 [Segatella copri]